MEGGRPPCSAQPLLIALAVFLLMLTLHWQQSTEVHVLPIDVIWESGVQEQCNPKEAVETLLLANKFRCTCASESKPRVLGFTIPPPMGPCAVTLKSGTSQHDNTRHSNPGFSITSQEAVRKEIFLEQPTKSRV